MRLSELIGNLYQSFITEDWLLAENLFDKYFNTIDKNHIGESYSNVNILNLKNMNHYSYSIIHCHAFI